VEVNAGQLTFWGPSSLGGTVAVAAGATLNFGSGRGPGPTLNADARVSGAGDVAFHGVSTTVLGSVQMSGPGTVRFESGTTFVTGLVAARAGLTVGWRGLVMGAGTLRGPVRNEGHIGPGKAAEHLGVLTIDGDYVQTREGSLHIDIDASGSDHLAVKGKVTLDGNLYVYWNDPNSSPALDAVYTVLFCGTYEEGGSLSVRPQPPRFQLEKGLDADGKVLTLTVMGS
jgi:hypothetical protein